MNVEPREFNPYATPGTVSDSPLARRPQWRPLSMRCLIALQAAVIVVALIFEFRGHESIVASGPVFSLVGLAIAIVALRRRDHVATWFGASAIAFSLLIVFLINYNSWSPAQGDRPITILAYGYAAIALPISAWLAIAPNPTASFAGER